MHYVLDDDEVELLLLMIDINVRAIRATLERDIGDNERIIHSIRLVSLRRIRTKLAEHMN